MSLGWGNQNYAFQLNICVHFCNKINMNSTIMKGHKKNIGSPMPESIIAGTI